MQEAVGGTQEREQSHHPAATSVLPLLMTICLLFPGIFFLPVLVLSEKQNHSHKDGLALQGCLWLGSLECSPEMSEEGHAQLRVLGSQT